MKTLNLLLIATTFILTSCQSSNNKTMHPLPPIKIKPSEIVSVHNIGTLCYRRTKPKELETIYFPHNTGCASSSAYENNYSTHIAPQGAEFDVEIFGYYKQKHSQIALADCAGAGVQRKKIHLLSSAPITIKWNGDRLEVLPSEVGKIYCFRRDGSKIVKDDKLKSYVIKISSK